MALKSNPADWTDPRHRRGVAGERAAIGYLRTRGWVILHHRFRMGRLEIDLVARREGVVAFIEVKTRRSSAFGSPLEAVTWRKQREIGRVAQAWIDRHGAVGYTYRFDVIAVTLVDPGPPQVEHVADAFRLGWR